MHLNVLLHLMSSFISGRADEKYIFGTEGNISSPGFPYWNYDNYEHIIWYLHSPQGHRIFFQVYHIDLEHQENCLYDYLKLEDQPGEKIAQVCDNLSKQLYVSRNNTAIVTFISDHEDTFVGFLLHWYSIDINKCKNQVISGTSGIIESLNYPVGVPGNVSCRTRIQVPKDSRIWLNIEQFTIENVDGTCGDNLLLNLGINKTEKLCHGTNEHGRSFLSYSWSMLLDFNTVNEGFNKGFYAAYKAGKKYLFLYNYFFDLCLLV